MGTGIDPFIWRGAFGERIFSTYGTQLLRRLRSHIPDLLTQFLQTRRWSLIVLMSMLLVDLYATGTKARGWVCAGGLPLRRDQLHLLKEGPAYARRS